MPNDIEIHENADLKDATIVIGIPGVGFSSPIATSYLIKALEMERVGHVVSSDFPPVASVHEFEPQHPMRIYQKGNVVARASSSVLWVPTCSSGPTPEARSGLSS